MHTHTHTHTHAHINTHIHSHTHESSIYAVDTECTFLSVFFLSHFRLMHEGAGERRW